MTSHRLKQGRLDFGASFYLNRSVSAADDQVTSVSADDSKAQNAAVAFTTTHWSVVMEAQGDSPAAQEALEKLCRTYWRPIYSFVRRQGVGQEEAEDLTQGFFALFLERRSKCNSQRKGTVAFLSDRIGQKFFGRRTAPSYGNQTRKRRAARSVGSTGC